MSNRGVGLIVLLILKCNLTAVKNYMDRYLIRMLAAIDKNHAQFHETPSFHTSCPSDGILYAFKISKCTKEH